MRVVNKGNTTYEISATDYSCTLTLSKNPESLGISITQESSEVCKSTFTFEDFLLINKRFRGFDTTEEIFEDLQYMIETKNFLLDIDQKILSYHLGKQQITLPIIQNTEKEKNAFCTERIKNLENEEKGLIQKIEAFKKVSKVLNKKSELDYNKIISSINQISVFQKMKIKQNFLIFNIKKAKTQEAEIDIVDEPPEPKEDIKEDITKEDIKENIKEEIFLKNYQTQKTLIPQISSSREIFSFKKTSFTQDKDILLHMKEEEVKKDHKDFVYSICLLPDRRFASCSHDKTIKVFSTTTLQCKLTLIGHEGYVYHISLLDSGFLASASADKTIRIWELGKYSYKCVGVLEGHTNGVYKVIQLSRNRICSCSYDKTLKIWSDSSPYECIATLNGHNDWVISCLELTSKAYIVSSGYACTDNTVRFWSNSFDYKCEKIIFNIGCLWNGGMIEIENRVVVGGKNDLAIINLKKLILEKRIRISDAHFIFSLLNLKNGEILCGNGRGELFIVDINAKHESRATIQRKQVHKSIIKGLLLIDDYSLVTCGEDKVIKFWK